MLNPVTLHFLNDTFRCLSTLCLTYRHHCVIFSLVTLVAKMSVCVYGFLSPTGDLFGHKHSLSGPVVEVIFNTPVRGWIYGTNGGTLRVWQELIRVQLYPRTRSQCNVLSRITAQTRTFASVRVRTCTCSSNI